MLRVSEFHPTSDRLLLNSWIRLRCTVNSRFQLVNHCSSDTTAEADDNPMFLPLNLSYLQTQEIVLPWPACTLRKWANMQPEDSWDIPALFVLWETNSQQVELISSEKRATPFDRWIHYCLAVMV